MSDTPTGPELTKPYKKKLWLSDEDNTFLEQLCGGVVRKIQGRVLGEHEITPEQALPGDDLTVLDEF